MLVKAHLSKQKNFVQLKIIKRYLKSNNSWKNIILDESVSVCKKIRKSVSKLFEHNVEEIHSLVGR